VRAPGVKWTLLALRRESPDGAATASMKTAPVNQSLGPAAVSTLFLVICMGASSCACCNDKMKATVMYGQAMNDRESIKVMVTP
jgi:hypothetical protein